MLSATGGVGPGMDLFRVGGLRVDVLGGLRVDDLARVLQDSQARAMEMADKLLRISVQQAIQDSSVGTRIDVTA